jgi:hypothetical protein
VVRRPGRAGALALVAVGVLPVLVGALAGCTHEEALVDAHPDFCTHLIAGVADYTDFAGAVLAGAEVTAAERGVAGAYVADLRASTPEDAEVAAALAVFTTPYDVDQQAQGQQDAAPEPVDADGLKAATATLLTACATA